MKHMPLIGNMSRDGSYFGGGFGQILDDNEEGTECVIDFQSNNNSKHDGYDRDDQEYHPPMCGQAFISKVISHSSKKKKALRGILSSNRRPLFYLHKNNTKSSLGYHETFSMEQPQDSESESITSRNSGANGVSKVVPMDNSGSTPPYILQFDPNDLSLIQMEKEQGDAKSKPDTSGAKHSTSQPVFRIKGKPGRTTSSSHSPFCPIALPTVTEEKSFELDDKSVSAEQPQLLPACNNNGNLLPSVSSTSSSSCSSFFGPVNSTEEEGRDDDEPKVSSRLDENVTSEIRNENEESNESTLRPTSPEMMQILRAMRQIIIKQQDAIQAISNENLEFRNQLALCHQDMQIMKTESSEQLIQITQLVIQKQGLEVETTRLKAELDELRNEIIALKSDDVDLANRFERLMSNEDEENETKSDIGHAISEEQQQRSLSPINVTINKIVDDDAWRRMMSSFDSSIDGNPLEKINTSTNDENPVNDSQKTYTKPSNSVEDMTDTTMGNSFSSSGSITAETLQLGTSSGGGTTGSATSDRKSDDVIEFKSRLEEIQKKRMMRMSTSAQFVRKSPSVRFA